MDKQHGKFKNFISKTKDFFLELLYPSNFTCDICGKEMDHETKYHVCEDCEKVATNKFSTKWHALLLSIATM